MIGFIDKAGIPSSEDKLLVGHYNHLPKLKELLGLPAQPEAAALGEATNRADPREFGTRGMGGVGKSTLAQRLYDDTEVRDWFKFDSMVWVKVGQNIDHRGVCNLQQDILCKLCDEAERSRETLRDPEDGRRLIRSRLRGRRVLIILDDVWEGVPDASDVVRKEDLGPGSRILKTFRDETTIAGLVHELDVLTPELSWELFCSCAKVEGQPLIELAGLAELALEAVKRCGGLPLAITLLGNGVLKFDRDDKKRSYLKAVCDLRASEGSPLAQKCYAVLKTSYEHLPWNTWKDAFCLIAGLWPSTYNFREPGRVVQNLGAALYPHKPVIEQYELARAALTRLAERSFLEVKKLTNWEEFNLDWLTDGFYRVSVHDILVEVATNIVEKANASAAEGSSVFESEGTRAARHIVVNNLDDLWTPVQLPRGPLSSLIINVRSKPLLELPGTAEGLNPYGTCKLLVLTRFGEGNAEGIGRSMVCTQCLLD